MKYGYARVSTEDQNPAMQLAALKKAGCKTVFKDEVTGAHVNRPALTRCLKNLETGDTLIVWKLDRLGRSLRDLIHMLDDFKQQGIKFRSLTEAIDTETPTGRAMWQMIGVLAELERSLITERTRAGVKAAQKRGVKFGRKVKLTPDRLAHARKLIDQGTTTDRRREDHRRRPHDPLRRFAAAALLRIRNILEMDILAASIKENLWHKMRSDLASYIPQLTENNLLMCCTCGRFLPYEDFSLEHIIPRQALADDPKEIKTNPKTTANARSGNILLCNKLLSIKGRRVYDNGCNSWKGRFYDGLIREILNGEIFAHKHKTFSNSAYYCSVLFGLHRDGFQIRIPSRIDAVWPVNAAAIFSPLKILSRYARKM